VAAAASAERPPWALPGWGRTCARRTFALHPGLTRTSFGAEDPSGVQRRLVPFARPFMQTPAQGAATSIQLASALDLQQVTGRYFANGKPKRSSRASHDQAVAARLWQVSAELVGLTVAG
jgi:retinol dehydrogenase-14